MSVALATNISTLIREYAGHEQESTARDAILMNFFSKTVAIHQYVLSQKLQLTGMSAKGRTREFTVLTYSDNSQWVLLQHATRMRFCGFLYLEKALKHAGSDTVLAAPNKMAIYRGKVIYLSQYCGETRVNMFDNSSAFTTLTQVGFDDTLGGCNLRKKDDTVYVFDTEKTSFNSRVYNEIEEFGAFHDMIYSAIKN